MLTGFLIEQFRQIINFLKDSTAKEPTEKDKSNRFQEMFYYDVNYQHMLNAYTNKAALTKAMDGLKQHCHFPSSQKTEVTYVCFHNEACCPNGCCISSFKRMMQFWYFWILFVIVCIAFTGCLHYCAKIRESRLDRRFQRRGRAFSQRLFRANRMLYRRPSDIDPHCPIERRLQQSDLAAAAAAEDPRRRNLYVQRLGGQRVVEPFDRDVILEGLWESYRNNQNNTQISKPPDYSEIEKDSQYLEPPPRYADACRIAEGNHSGAQTTVVVREIASVHRPSDSGTAAQNQANPDETAGGRPAQ